ncbi:SH3 domain-containing protein [Limimaricola sp.]|uniref:SH3 domain-containing protein n=1 Tax=Limimaricola sp. TaxID=2211665 RepID=UPI0025C2E157|nr:SH3 domain-containing protein [Limimaricola sp.]
MSTKPKLSSVMLAAGLAALIAGPAAAVDATAVTAVNVRSGPGVSFNQLDTLFAGEVVNVTECQSGWCYVEHDGPDGWVSGHYLSAAGSGGGTGSGGTGGGSGSGSDSGGGTGAGSGGGTATGSAAGDAALAIILGTILNGMSSHSAPAPAPAPAPGADLPYGPDTCKDGFVWRDAVPGDHVCVTPAARAQAAHENAIAGSRVNPTGAYGPNSCKPGFVWREAYSGDVVCVTPVRRTAVHQENADGPSHRVLP